MTSARSQVLAGCRSAAHHALYLGCLGGAKAFDRALDVPRAAQLSRLRRALAAVDQTSYARAHRLACDTGPEAFRERVPESNYHDIARFIELQRQGRPRELTREPCARYQPTSGSSTAIKWIPYTRAFLAELDAAISPWGFDLYRRVPGVRRGRHYWSLSWVPTALREKTEIDVNDDHALFSPLKRAVGAVTSPVPSWVAQTKTSEESFFATICFLCGAHDLTLLSVWSPTFALELANTMFENRHVVADVLEGARWSDVGRDMPGLPPRSKRASRALRAWRTKDDPEFFKDLWPELALVSAWDTSSSAPWAARLANLLPHARFQGKGLWATEGVVTIPHRGEYPLAIRSHYYEFVCLETDKPFFSWELKRGQVVRPLLTTSGGLLRYRLDDRLVVRGFAKTTPCFEYLGRIQDVDLVGEKIDPETARQALSALKSASCSPLSLLAVAAFERGQRPFYLALCEGPSGSKGDPQREAWLEDRLLANFHYRLARDLGQLGCARVLTVPDAMRFYQEVAESGGQVKGSVKLEPLRLCDTRGAVASIASGLALAARPPVHPPETPFLATDGRRT